MLFDYLDEKEIEIPEKYFEKKILPSKTPMKELLQYSNKLKVSETNKRSS